MHTYTSAAIYTGREWVAIKQIPLVFRVIRILQSSDGRGSPKEEHEGKNIRRNVIGMRAAEPKISLLRTLQQEVIECTDEYASDTGLVCTPRTDFQTECGSPTAQDT